MADYPSRTSLQKLRVVDLKEKLSALGLPVGGLKADLVSRLYDYHVKASQEALDNEQEDDDDSTIDDVQRVEQQQKALRGHLPESSRQVEHEAYQKAEQDGSNLMEKVLQQQQMIRAERQQQRAMGFEIQQEAEVHQHQQFVEQQRQPQHGGVHQIQMTNLLTSQAPPQTLVQSMLPTNIPPPLMSMAVPPPEIGQPMSQSAAAPPSMSIPPPSIVQPITQSTPLPPSMSVPPPQNVSLPPPQSVFQNMSVPPPQTISVSVPPPSGPSLSVPVMSIPPPNMPHTMAQSMAEIEDEQNEPPQVSQHMGSSHHQMAAPLQPLMPPHESQMNQQSGPPPLMSLPHPQIDPSQQHRPLHTQRGLPHQQMGPPHQQMGPPNQQMEHPSEIGPPPEMASHQQMGPPSERGPPPERLPLNQQMGPPSEMGPPNQQRGPPPEMGPPHQQRGPLTEIGPPHQQMGFPPQQMGPPRQQMGPPHQQMGPPHQPMGPPRQQMGPPHQQMSSSPRHMGPPQQQMGPPQQQMGPPHQQMGPPHQHMGPPHQQMGPPHQQMGPPPQHVGPPHQQIHPPHQQMGPPHQQMGPPHQQTGPPHQQTGPPHQQMPPFQQMHPPPHGMPPPQMSLMPEHDSQHEMSLSHPPIGGPGEQPMQPLINEDSRPMDEPEEQSDQGQTQSKPPDSDLADRHFNRGSGKPIALMDLDIPPPNLTRNRSATRKEPKKDPEPTVEPQPPPVEIKLPQALEKVLAFKDERAQQVGVDVTLEGDVEHYSSDEAEDNEEDLVGAEDEEDEEESQRHLPKSKAPVESKNRKRKKKKKQARQNRFAKELEEQRLNKQISRRRRGRYAHTKRLQAAPPITPILPQSTNVNIDYVPDHPEIEPSDPFYYTFTRIFEVFKISESGVPKKSDEKKDASGKEQTTKTVEEKDVYHEDDPDEDKDKEENKEKLSKKKMKKLSRLSVAELKQLVSRPDVVEMHDVTAQDPRLLVHLKSTRNTVPVPRHWCFKRKYLQGKRGIEKPPFELPEYIRDTGIMEMRQALQDKEEAQNLKSKMREKIRPKMGKIDIDYQKLHDAFFKWQSKPKMTIHGDLYYEGKEFETKLKEKKPGNLSDEMRIALGMPVGPNADKVPPPWLIAMQRYGPPPSYPTMKIAGLNAAIPEGCAFGYHAGGWGKPPVDNMGKPLYGDVFGTTVSETKEENVDDGVDRVLWGEMESESESEAESEDEGVPVAEEPESSGLITPGPEGLVTPSGLTSVPLGMETPDMIELRKKRIEDAMDQGAETPALYQVIPEKRTTVGAAMMGSAHVYDLAAAKKSERVAAEGVEVALNPDELDLDTAAMQAKYDETLREQQSQIEKDDLTDMVAEHAAKQKKRKQKQQDSGKSAKKYKEFKF